MCTIKNILKCWNVNWMYTVNIIIDHIHNVFSAEKVIIIYFNFSFFLYDNILSSSIAKDTKGVKKNVRDKLLSK